MKPLPRTLTISVTQRDIDKGVRSDCAFCPIALAMRRELRRQGFVNNRVHVGGTLHVTTRRAGKVVGGYHLPQQAANFMGSFDNAIVVNPITFTTGLRPR